MNRDDMESAAEINSIEVRGDEPAAAKGVLPMWQYRKLAGLGINMEGYTYDPYDFRPPKEGGTVRFANREARRRSERARRRA